MGRPFRFVVGGACALAMMVSGADTAQAAPATTSSSWRAGLCVVVPPATTNARATAATTIRRPLVWV